MESAVGARAEELVLHLLMQLIAILAVTRLLVVVVRRLGQTEVTGEILAGLLLGPSCLGALAPGLLKALFPASTASIFTGLSQLSLVLLMFQIGLEFEFTERLGQRKRAVVLVAVSALVVPFAAGYMSAPWFHARLPDGQPALAGFRLFFAVAMSITAIPILGRIFMELGLSHTRTATLTIAAAAIEDVVGWLLLGGIALAVQNRFHPGLLALRVVGVLTLTAFVLYVARPLLRRALAAHLGTEGRLSQTAIALVLIAVFASAIATSLLGVFAIIGGFLVGVALHQERRFVAQWKAQVAPFVTALLLPLFFTYTGLRTDIGSLGDGKELVLCALVCVVAFTSKMGGAYLAARVAGEPPREALAIAVCMNTRALMELIALNIGYDLGVIPRSMFTKLVVMAIVSTYVATPLIRRLMRGQERFARVAA